MGLFDYFASQWFESFLVGPKTKSKQDLVDMQSRSL